MNHVDPAGQIVFLRKPPRAEIAVLCRNESRTRDELAELLDRQPGGLTTPDTMLRNGALVTAGRRPSGGSRPGGELLALSPAWADSLELVLREHQPPGLPSGMDLVLVTTSTTVRACEAIAADGTAISWGAVLRGERMGLAICASGEANDDSATLRLLDRLDRAGATAIRLHFDRVLPAAELREWARRIAPPPPTLLGGSEPG